MIESLKLLCGSGRCPRVFLKPDGGFLVQGVVVSAEMRKDLDPLPNEEVVELPAEVVAELLANLKKS